MAASPQFKIYDEFKDYLGCFRDIYDAGNFCLNCGRKGFTIRKGHRVKDIIWTEPQLKTRKFDQIAGQADGATGLERRRSFNDMARHHLPKGSGMPLEPKDDCKFFKAQK